MTDAEKKPPNSRRGTSGAASRRSSWTARTGSRPSSPSRQLNKILSGNHLDDHGHYRHHPHDEEAVADEESSDVDVEEKDTDEDITPTSSDEVYENRDGIEDIRDIEFGPKLKTTRSRRSTRSTKLRDPNLVTWEGPDDIENPKNWAFSRKWAATIIGTGSPHPFQQHSVI
jgi:hypothetical protein